MDRMPLGFISSKCTNENYLMQKLARAVIGTNNGQLLALLPVACKRRGSFARLIWWRFVRSATLPSRVGVDHRQQYGGELSGGLRRA